MFTGTCTTSILFTAALFFSQGIFAKTLHVGPGQPYATLTAAAVRALPGDTILFHAGVYPGGEQLVRLQGRSAARITIMALPHDTVVIRGGTAGWAFRQVAYLTIQHIVFEQQTGNGFNMDDGAIPDSPSHHIRFNGCTFRNINATGNNDLLKLSGVDSFSIVNCVFQNGAKNGSGIDMVGCHRGIIKQCRFEHMGSNAVQAKGGSQFIRIERNFFKNGGERTLNLGGSTGLAYFRPQQATFEAADLQVYSNIIVGSQAPIAYVGCTRVEVINNTLYQPEKWVVRILQENKDARFIPCSHNVFRNNIVYHGNKVSTDCNIGGGTDAGSFQFSTNLWYNHENSQWNGPAGLPVKDSGTIVGKDPLFADAGKENFSIPAPSPAAGKGSAVVNPRFDFGGMLFDRQRSIGSYELKKAARRSGPGVEGR